METQKLIIKDSVSDIGVEIDMFNDLTSPHTLYMLSLGVEKLLKKLRVVNVDDVKIVSEYIKTSTSISNSVKTDVNGRCGHESTFGYCSDHVK